MNNISKNLVETCRERLLLKKEEILNQMIEIRNEHFSRDNGTDEADLSQAVLAEDSFLRMQGRYRELLLEIESALMRIERGQYGLCEETEEPIEEDRLMALPWTRLSIEGAEIQESLKKRYR